MCITGMKFGKPAYGQKELEEALELWCKIAEKYQHLEEDYNRILEEAKAKNVSSKTPKPKALDKVEFYKKYNPILLKKETKEEAEEYLLDLSPKEIRIQIAEAKEIEEDPYYKNKRIIIDELKILIKNKKTAGKTIFQAPQAQKL